jgi:hypothetical protein
MESVYRAVRLLVLIREEGNFAAVQKAYRDKLSCYRIMKDEDYKKSTCTRIIKQRMRKKTNISVGVVAVV